MRKKSLIVLIIMLTIGFAAVSTTLIINGTINLGFDDSDYEVIFSEAKLDGLHTENTIISDDKKSITFRTDKLSNVDESTTLTYKVKNNSTQYKADVTISCTNINSSYISVESIFDGHSLPYNETITINPQEEKNGSIKATLNVLPEEETKSETIRCDIVTNASSNDTVINRPETGVYKEALLNGTDPVLSNGISPLANDSKNLIPVTIANDGTVTYADINTKWYSYENKVWANAVILNNGVSKSVGDTIKEEEIESYFVWIPKYQYKLWNVDNTELVDLSGYSYDSPEVTNLTNNSNARTIEIRFGTENTTDVEGKSCATPMTSGATGNCNNGEWMTHSAFISLGVNGIWVGKFETGYKGATSTAEAQINSNDSSKIIVKPNVYSWRGNTVSNMFKSAYNYERELDSHMMKNTEWGAVAYLSHSIYGIDRELNINNNSSYKTGYSAMLTTLQGIHPGESGDGSNYNKAYNTSIGYLASTTGNISGIYDMSGGAVEYMSSYISGNVGSSGFTTSTIANYNIKYFDIYNNASTTTAYQYRILGDATGEMGPFVNYKDDDGNTRYHNNWYGDDSTFIDSSYPWFYRSGHYYNGVLAGQFFFSWGSGSIGIYGSSRIVLSPSN